MKPPIIENVKMIVVEDDDNLRKQLKIALEFFLNRLVLTFKNGRKAWDHIQENPVDIILSDVNMPEMDGLELLRRVKDQYPEIIVVNMSGKGDNLEEAGRLGSNCTLLKPFKLAALAKIVQDFISGD